MENTTESTTKDGFATLDTLATSFTESDIDAAVAELKEIDGDLIAKVDAGAPKMDRRKGERKIKNVDGTVSYGLKADGTPRSKPGRKTKTIDVI